MDRQKFGPATFLMMPRSIKTAMKLPSYKLRPKICQTYYLLYVLLVIPPIFRVIRVFHNSG